MKFTLTFLALLTASGSALAEPGNDKDTFQPDMQQASQIQDWANWANTPGARAACTYYGFKGVCDFSYQPAKFGKCQTFDENGDKKIVSVLIGDGGQCTFWNDRACKGDRRLTLNSKTSGTRFPNLGLYGWAMTARSVACWDNTDCIKGTNCGGLKVQNPFGNKIGRRDGDATLEELEE